MAKAPTKTTKPAKGAKGSDSLPDRTKKAPGIAKYWPADKVERRAIERLIPSARNARVHSDAQVAQLADAIKRWGWTIPVLIDSKGELIAGHGRVLAAKTLGITDVPVVIAKGWSDEQKRAYRLADNQLALNSSWDTALLTSELTDLAEDGFELPAIGFDDQFLDTLMGDHSLDGAESDGHVVTDNVTSLSGANGDYQPNLTPERNQGEVTSQDLEKAADKLLAKPGDMASQDLVEVICPHCGQSYELDRKSITG